MKLGLDLHKTITYDPEYFVSYAQWVRSNGGEVHILTGSKYGTNIQAELLDYGNGVKWWDEFFSITDYLLIGTPHTTKVINGKKNFFFPPEIWNHVKADYCRSNDIDLHIDDCEEYLKHFTTPYMLYKGKNKQSRPTESKSKQLKPWSDYEV